MLPIEKNNINLSRDTILLTGATGFLGSHLLKNLLEEGATVYITLRSTKRPDALSSIKENSSNSLKIIRINDERIEDYFSSIYFSSIIHCATNYGRSDKNLVEMIKSNLLFPLELLTLSKKYHVHTFINTDTILDKRISEYSLSKRQFFDWLGYFSSEIYIANARLEHFYGPGDDPSKFVTNVMRSLLRMEEKIELSPGEQKRDFIYISDVVSAFMKILEHSHSSSPNLESFDIATGTSIKLKDFVNRVKVISGNSKTNLLFGALPYRPNETMDPQLDLGKIRGLGWRPLVSLDDGLKQTLLAERKLL